jgi:hypothetical protein
MRSQPSGDRGNHATASARRWPRPQGRPGAAPAQYRDRHPIQLTHHRGRPCRLRARMPARCRRYRFKEGRQHLSSRSLSGLDQGPQSGTKPCEPTKAGSTRWACLGAHAKLPWLCGGLPGMDDVLYRRRELVEGLALFVKIFVLIINSADAGHDAAQATLGMVRPLDSRVTAQCVANRVQRPIGQWLRFPDSASASLQGSPCRARA